MSYRYTTRLFKPQAKQDIVKAVFASAATIGARAKQVKFIQGPGVLGIGVRNGVFICDLSYCDGEALFFSQLAQELGSIWLEARIQEGSHWDYTLSYPLQPLDTFSTLPQYWEDDELVALANRVVPSFCPKHGKFP